MKKLSKPRLDPSRIYDKCISSCRDRSKKIYLESLKGLVSASAGEYEQKAANNQLHLQTKHQYVHPQYIKNLYKEKMVAKSGPCRAEYDLLLSIPPFGICPLCNSRPVNTLDHQLPKVEFPELSVLPTNLVPSCRDCNSEKLAEIPSTEIERTFHPYYDDFGSGEWLFAKISNAPNFVIMFEVQQPPQWTNIQFRRTESHFIAFSLNKLYSSLACQELQLIEYQLEQLFESGGALALREHLEDSFQSIFIADQNNWKGALYRALMSSEWYCNQRFA